MPRQDPGEPFYRVDSNEAARLVEEAGSEAAIVDVRRDDEWVSGHASGAMHIPIDDLLGRMDELPTDKKLFFICAAGVRSGLACEMAASMGYSPENLFNIEDGTPAWIEGNNPTSYGDDP